MLKTTHVGPQLWARSQGNQGKQDPGHTLKKVRVQRVRWAGHREVKGSVRSSIERLRMPGGGGANKVWRAGDTAWFVAPWPSKFSDFTVTSPCLLQSMYITLLMVHAKHQDSAGGEIKETDLLAYMHN